jgi:predicted transcriptional regulator
MGERRILPATGVTNLADLLETLAYRDVAMEAALIAEAEAEADAGLLIPSATVNVWIDSLGTDAPLAMPRASGNR